MLTSRGQVKVLDFGLAKVGRCGISTQKTTTESLSSPGEIAGTLHYMSPEQCLGREADARSDISSVRAQFSTISPLGSTLFQAIHRPWCTMASSTGIPGHLHD